MISAARLAWLQLRRQKVRFAVALAGVAFAVVLMLMQLGFRDALFTSAVVIHRRLTADVVLVHPNYNILPFPALFPRRRLYQALGFDGVESVTPLYTALGRWKNPVTGLSRTIFVVGIDPVEDVLDVPEVNAARTLMRYPDVVLYDELSRPEFGPIAATLRAGEEVGTEVSGRRVTVGGLFRLGCSFGIDATMITSDLNFLRLFPYQAPGAITAGLIRLRPGADPRAVRDALAAALPRDVDVLTKDGYIAREIGYWQKNTPIGYVFTFGVLMGLVVGAIIVYQILFADIADHLSEYATLKAIGYTRRYLAAVVLMEALILAVVGYAPAVGTSVWLYGVTAAATGLPMRLTPERAVLALGLTIVMCWVSGLIAMRKLSAADPAEIF
jgi:putative ABC transport system permease protein